MDPIEIADCLAGRASLRYKPVTIRTTDREELANFKHNLPSDYNWVEPDETLLQALEV